MTGDLIDRISHEPVGCRYNDFAVRKCANAARPMLWVVIILGDRTVLRRGTIRQGSKSVDQDLESTHG